MRAADVENRPCLMSVRLSLGGTEAIRIVSREMRVSVEGWGTNCSVEFYLFHAQTNTDNRKH